MARIVVVSEDPDTCRAVISTLGREHDVRAVGREWSPAGGRRRRTSSGGRAASDRGRAASASTGGAPLPDVFVVDAPVLLERGGAAGLVPATRGRRRGVRGGRLGPHEREGTPRASSLRLKARAPAVLALFDPGSEGRVVAVFEAGADDYLVRPLDPDALRAKVERILAERIGLGTPSDSFDPVSISDDGRFLRRDADGKAGAANGGAAGAEEEGDVRVDLGRYEVLGTLGKGGYGVVYRARDRALGREVALKVLPRDLHDNPEAVTRFFRESSAIARLNHPNIVRFYELGSYQGRLYFTMELVAGATLKRVVDDHAPLPAARAARYVAAIARALAAIDSLGLVHRDVKPENAIVTADDQVKLIDFGLVKIRDTAAITSQDDVLGTPYFMAPEYIRAPGVPDIRFDLYALGVTFFQLLTGEYPFDGKNPAHVMEKHLRCPPPALHEYQPDAPPLAARIVERLLEKDPARRFQRPEEVLTALRPLLG